MFKDSPFPHGECPFQAFLSNIENDEKEAGAVENKIKGVYPPGVKQNKKTGGQTPMNQRIVSITNGKSIFKEVMAEPGKMFDLLRVDVKLACERAISEMIKAELTYFIGREKYERLPGDSSGEMNYRNGYYERTYTTKGMGTLTLTIARDRLGKFNSQLIKKYGRYEKCIMDP